MIPAAIELDFIRTSRRFSAIGLLALALGIGVATWTVLDYQNLQIESSMLEMQLDAVTPQRRGASGPTEVDTRGVEEAGSAVLELSLPWSRLLDELEAAGTDSRDDVALLSVEPDPERQRVRIGAEARSLPAALLFAQRLQQASTLEFPLLDNHKMRTEQRERPVYFELTADWKLP